jgi:hypothetical protein
MIRIPMGCDPQTKQRSYYNRTVHGSLRQAQKFLGKKVNELGAYIERDGAKIRLDQYLDQWLKAIKSQICIKTYEKLRESARKIYPSITWQEASCGHQAVGRPRRLSDHVRSGTLAKDGTRCSLVLNRAFRQALRWEMIGARKAQRELGRVLYLKSWATVMSKVFASFTSVVNLRSFSPRSIAPANDRAKPPS